MNSSARSSPTATRPSSQRGFPADRTGRDNGDDIIRSFQSGLRWSGLGCLILALMDLATAFAASVRKPRLSDPSAEFFGDTRVRTIQITVGDAALAQLKKDNRNYVSATVTEGTNVLPNVGVHLKGMGSFQQLDQKPSFAVKFDRYTPGQEYAGLTKLMLNNSSQDGTFLAELLGTDLFRDAGVPVARVTHAFVEFNGRKLGLYVVIEAMNKEFLKRHFRSAKGNLYEAYLADIDSRMDQDSGTDASQTDVKSLLEASKVSDPHERWVRLPEVFEVDTYLSHLVCEMYASATDGYAMNRNNYRLYRDPATGRFTMIGHGLDWAYANTELSIRTPLGSGSLLTRSVLQTPDGRRLYRERCAQVFTNHFRLEVFTNRVNAAVAKLKAAARTPDEARQFEHGGVEMRNRLVARHASIARQIALPEPEPIRFDAAGVARLTGWTTLKSTGEAQLDTPAEAGLATLHIKAGASGCAASWRASVILPTGTFRLLGRARSTALDPDRTENKVGAGLRISGSKRTNELSGDAPWTELSHEFTTAFDGEEKTMVCELRAKSGEVWFDTASLRLQRVK